MVAPEIYQNIGEESLMPEELELPSENDLMVLKALGGDNDAENLSFQGIKRKLGLHQETLSRALHRLQRDGFVERTDHAYRLSPKGLTTVSQYAPHFNPKTPTEENFPMSVLKAMLPSDTNIEDIASSLRYKWFGNLRWLGSTQNEDSVTLTWIANDSDLKVSVKILSNSLTIETYPTSAESVSLAVRSAYELFDHISRVFKNAGREQSRQSYGRAA